MGTTYLNGIPTETGAFIIEGASSLLDDIALGVGSASPASFLWETADDNANEFIINLPAGGAVDVPVIAIGQGIKGVDLGLYNGVVDPRIALFGIGARTTGTILEFRKARGTIAAPTAITAGDDLGSIVAYACVADGEYVESSSIKFESVETIATTRAPGRIEFWTATNAAPSVPTRRGYIDHAGALQWAAAANFASFGVATTMAFQADGGKIVAWQTTDKYFTLEAFDNSVGNVELLRVQAAADPYIRIGRNDTGVATNAVTDHQVWQAGAGGAVSAGFGYGLSVIMGNDQAAEVEKRGYLNWVLTTATNAAEAVKLDIGLMAAGALGVAASLSAVGDFNALLSLSVAGTKVVGARVVDARADDVVDSTYGAEEAGVLDALRDAMIAHGLIAAA